MSANRCCNSTPIIFACVRALKNNGMTPFPEHKSTIAPCLIGTYVNLASKTASSEKEKTEGL